MQINITIQEECAQGLKHCLGSLTDGVEMRTKWVWTQNKVIYEMRNNNRLLGILISGHFCTLTFWLWNELTSEPSTVTSHSGVSHVLQLGNHSSVMWTVHFKLYTNKTELQSKFYNEIRDFIFSWVKICCISNQLRYFFLVQSAELLQSKATEINTHDCTAGYLKHLSLPFSMLRTTYIKKTEPVWCSG